MCIIIIIHNKKNGFHLMAIKSFLLDSHPNLLIDLIDLLTIELLSIHL